MITKEQLIEWSEKESAGRYKSSGDAFVDLLARDCYRMGFAAAVELLWPVMIEFQTELLEAYISERVGRDIIDNIMSDLESRIKGEK
jgi:hypothetical protein